MFRLFRRDREEGVALVEFAIVLPMFVLLVFGIMEAGWLFAQEVELRNATREGARLAVVDYGTGGEVIDETCARADLSGSGATMTVTVNGDSVTFEAAKTYESLTGVLDSFVDIPMSSSTEMRTEVELVNLSSDSKVCP